MSPVFRREGGFVFKIFSNEEERMQIYSENNTRSTSASVLMINEQGLMLSVLGNDYFVSYNRLPWMKDARISDVLNIQMSGKHSIEWPALDIDLEVECLKHPERYPLIMKRNELDYIPT